MDAFSVESEFLVNGAFPVKKYKSNKSALSVYLVDIDCQVINGYFIYGIDKVEATGIETLVWHLDSSGGLLPKSLRGELIKPAWQFHGAENPLSDRDQSCYIATALGEKNFLTAMVNGLSVLDNIDAVFAGFGIPVDKKETEETTSASDHGDTEAVEDEPKLDVGEMYCLSEAGEGAMAWESTLQQLFPGHKSFWNRLITSDDRTQLSPRLWRCYREFYRPENLSIVIAGKLENVDPFLSKFEEYERNFYEQCEQEPFIRPWSQDLPKCVTPIDCGPALARFAPRNPNRDANGTICFGWRGCSSRDVETLLALKVLTAHLSIGPLWNSVVSSGLAHRISWCQLEYKDCCSLVTLHGIESEAASEAIEVAVKNVITEMVLEPIKLEEIRAVADRISWHFLRELESDPYLIVVSSLAKAERYGCGEKDQIEKRLNPRPVYLELMQKPAEYWQNLAQNYFVNYGPCVTKVLPFCGLHSALEPDLAAKPIQPEVPAEHTFRSSSRRASSLPRRGTSAVRLESTMAALSESVAATAPPAGLTGANGIPGVVSPTWSGQTGTLNSSSGSGSGGVMSTDEGLEDTLPTRHNTFGPLWQAVDEQTFPLGDHKPEVNDFMESLSHTAELNEAAAKSNFAAHPVKSYCSDGPEQNAYFPVNGLPLYTFLEDIKTSFVYATLVLDTTHVDDTSRRYIAPIVAALGATLCPRPPGLDTDAEIINPNEFNPPLGISDSQVSLGLNGEMMQSIFIAIVATPEKYDWVVGMFHYLLNKQEFNLNFLKFVTSEAVKGLASNYRLQTADIPNYDYFDAAEINLYSLVAMGYKPESNARLFVGRRRLDVMNDFHKSITNNPEQMVKTLNSVWRQIVDGGHILCQISTDVNQLSKHGQKNLVQPWKYYFGENEQTKSFQDIKLTLDTDMILTPSGEGISVFVNHPRIPCITTAIPINPNCEDFPKLCFAAQLFSMAQKWIWTCLGVDDVAMPALRMPCSYSNILTLSLECHDLAGALKVMKHVMDENWQWLEPLVIATQNMIIHDPAVLDHGPQGVSIISLLAHLNGISPKMRRTLVVQSINVTAEDVKEVISKYLRKLFDPKQCWYALMTDEMDRDFVLNSLKPLEFEFQHHDLAQLCIQL